MALKAAFAETVIDDAAACLAKVYMTRDVDKVRDLILLAADFVNAVKLTRSG